MMPPIVKLLFRSRNRLLLQSSIELVASLNVRILSASNELLSVLASFARHLSRISGVSDNFYEFSVSPDLVRVSTAN